VILTPPPTTAAVPPTTVPETTVGPGSLIFINLVDTMNGSFTFQFQTDKPVSNLTETASVTAVLEGASVWSKSIVVVPPTVETGTFTIDFPIDISGLTELLNSINAETGAAASSHTLVFRVDVEVTGESAFGPIDDVFSPTLSTGMDNGMIQWNENLSQTKSGSIETSETVANTNRYLGMSVGGARGFSISIACVLFLAYVFLVYLYTKTVKPIEPSMLEKEGIRLNKKYGERMALAITRTSDDGVNIVSFSAMEDLVKVSDELAKPIIYQPAIEPEGARLYYVLDGTTRYQYALGGLGESGVKLNLNKLNSS
jgi:hypothetical protein